jgi:enoyl-CoA hydratase/carnithine racemase
VIVGVSRVPIPPPVPLACDVLLSATSDPPAGWVGCPGGLEEGVARLVEHIAAWPTAACTLSQLLRAGETLTLEGALIAESLAYSTLQSGPEFARWLAQRNPRAAHSDAGLPVHVDRDGDLLQITLNRPARRNAFNAAMRDALIGALELALADETIAQVRVAGAGPAFCSGGDLDEFGALPDPATAHLIRTTRSTGARLARCAERTTVHLHGACVGAGIELPAFAGRVIAAPGTRIMLPEVAMGLVPGAGGTASIPRRIGRQRCAWLALSGEWIDSDLAQRWGLVDEVAAASV